VQRKKVGKGLRHIGKGADNGNNGTLHGRRALEEHGEVVAVIKKYLT
jgi:hypothetical protein